MEIVKEDNKVYILNEKGKEVAYVTFPKYDEQTVIIDHTFVDDSLRGMGIASKLMNTAYEVIEAHHWKAILQCSYAKTWFEKHPECQHIVL